MAGNSDRIFKISMENWAEFFLQTAYPDKTPVRLDPLNVEKTAWNHKREDGFFRATFSDGSVVYLHIEVQASNDPEMLERMMDYFVFDEPVQYVLYIGDAPMKMRNALDGQFMTYRYGLLDIRALPASVFLDQHAWRFWLFAYLTAEDTDARNKMLEKIVRRLFAANLSDLQWEEAIETLTALSTLRKEEAEFENKIRKMSLEIKYDLRKAPFYKDGFQDGEAKGKAEGKAEMIKNMAENGFPLEIIAKTAKLDVETVKKILND